MRPPIGSAPWWYASCASPFGNLTIEDDALSLSTHNMWSGFKISRTPSDDNRALRGRRTGGTCGGEASSTGQREQRRFVSGVTMANEAQRRRSTGARVAAGAMGVAAATLVFHRWRRRQPAIPVPEDARDTTVDAHGTQSAPVGSAPAIPVQIQPEHPKSSRPDFWRVLVWGIAAMAMVAWAVVLRPHDVGGVVVYWVLTVYAALILVLIVLVFRPKRGPSDVPVGPARTAPESVAITATARERQSKIPQP